MGVKVKQWKGAWWVFIHHKGKRKAKRCGSRKAAELVAMKIDAALKLGQLGVLDADRTPGPPPAPTFAQLAEEWLERYPLLRSVSRTTMENYRSFTRQHLIPFFGSTRVSETTPEQIEAFIAEKRSPEGSVRFRGKPISEQSLRVGLVCQPGVAEDPRGGQGPLPQPRAAPAHVRLNPPVAERAPPLRAAARGLAERRSPPPGLRPVAAPGATGRNLYATAWGPGSGSARRY